MPNVIQLPAHNTWHMSPPDRLTVQGHLEHLRVHEEQTRNLPTTATFSRLALASRPKPRGATGATQLLRHELLQAAEHPTRDGFCAQRVGSQLRKVERQQVAAQPGRLLLRRLG